jgi:hypothetical protein
MMMMLVMTVLRTRHILPYPAKAQGGVGETEEFLMARARTSPRTCTFP